MFPAPPGVREPVCPRHCTKTHRSSNSEQLLSMQVNHSVVFTEHAGRQERCEAFQMTVTSCSCMRSDTLQTCTRAKCAFRMCLRQTSHVRQLRSTRRNWNGSRLDHRDVSLLDNHHNCACAKMNLRLAPRRNTRINVRFEVCTMWILEIYLRVCNVSDEDCSVSSSWSSSGIVFSVSFAPSSSP